MWWSGIAFLSAEDQIEIESMMEGRALSRPVGIAKGKRLGGCYVRGVKELE